MPIKYVIAKSYTDEQDDSTEQRIFNPRNASEADFREFMVNMYQTQQAANVELVRLVGAQESMIKELRRLSSIRTLPKFFLIFFSEQPIHIYITIKLKNWTSMIDFLRKKLLKKQLCHLLFLTIENWHI